MRIEQREITRIVAQALAEDIGRGDITTTSVIVKEAKATMAIVTREPAIICGMALAIEAFTTLDKTVEITENARDGDCTQENTSLMLVRGHTRAILTGERVALNFLQHLCGVATLTAQYVAAVKHTKARILDTRKTIPGLRIMQKYAVATGGGVNHRLRLDDGVLIKDNHIALCGSITKAVQKVRAIVPANISLAVECDTLEQVEEALKADVGRILLDNMSFETLRAAVRLVAGKCELEASGGVTLKNVATIAETGVDYISVGALTHSPPAIDIGMDRIIE